jgi:TatD DNase family protein
MTSGYGQNRIWLMLIDTHCHIDAAEFNLDRHLQIQEAEQAGVKLIVVPAIHLQNFQQVIELSDQYSACYYALGWHPMYIDAATPDDMATLKTLIAQQIYGSKLVAIGEIGLDYFVTQQNKTQQIYYFTEQLKLAKHFDLPVILHVRRAIDDVLKYLRRYAINGGIAHAFNGSMHQAEAFIKLGFKLGFGGAMTYSRALRIREIAKNLSLDAIVLETDAPDIPPEWVGSQGRNSPKELATIAEVLAEIRGITTAQIIEITSKNAIQTLPRLGVLCT